MKQAIKDALPPPALKKAQQIMAVYRHAKNELHFMSLSKKDFNAQFLRPANALSLEDIFADKDIQKAWNDDHKDIAKVYGHDDNFAGVNPGDRQALYYLIMALKPQNTLEVGTHIGASTLHIARALKRVNEGGKLTTVDILDVNHPETGPWKEVGMAQSPQDFANTLGCGDDITFRCGPCLKFMNETSERFDFIFLDGDHTPQAVYLEIDAALNLLNENGVILLHDFYPEGKPLYPDNNIIDGPFKALRRISRENPEIDILPLGELPWPTKQGTSVTTLALVVKK